MISVVQDGRSDRWTEENDDNPRSDGVSRRPCPLDDDLEAEAGVLRIREALERPWRHPYWVPPKARHHRHH